MHYRCIHTYSTCAHVYTCICIWMNKHINNCDPNFCSAKCAIQFVQPFTITLFWLANCDANPAKFCPALTTFFFSYEFASKHWDWNNYCCTRHCTVAWILTFSSELAGIDWIEMINNLGLNTDYTIKDDFCFMQTCKTAIQMCRCDLMLSTCNEGGNLVMKLVYVKCMMSRTSEQFLTVLTVSKLAS